MRPNFDKLTPLFPDERFRLENGPLSVTERIIDMVAPIGKGQRGMVVSPPKAGKTTILKQIANGIINSSPDTHVIVLLVDERPEEVTDWQRTVQAAEVVYSTFDKPTDQHIQVTELVLERATPPGGDGPGRGDPARLAHPSGARLQPGHARPAARSSSGGIDSTALYPPRGSSAPRATSRRAGRSRSSRAPWSRPAPGWTTVIFEEFKGTGNMELRLDRSLAEKRLFPAINVDASGTRKEELLLPPGGARARRQAPPRAPRAGAGRGARAADRQDPGDEVERAVPEGDREGAVRRLVGWRRLERRSRR